MKVSLPKAYYVTRSTLLDTSLGTAVQMVQTRSCHGIRDDERLFRNVWQQSPPGSYPSSMTTSEVANKFVMLCRQGKNFDVMQTMYADNIVSVEAERRKTGKFETQGKEAVIEKSKEWAGAH